MLLTSGVSSGNKSYSWHDFHVAKSFVCYKTNSHVMYSHLMWLIIGTMQYHAMSHSACVIPFNNDFHSRLYLHWWLVNRSETLPFDYFLYVQGTFLLSRSDIGEETEMETAVVEVVEVPLPFDVALIRWPLPLLAAAEEVLLYHRKHVTGEVYCIAAVVIVV